MGDTPWGRLVGEASQGEVEEEGVVVVVKSSNSKRKLEIRIKVLAESLLT